MLHRLGYPTLFVRDQDKALDFYVNKLGFEKRAENRAYGVRFILIGLPGQDVGISLWKGTPSPPTDVAMGGNHGSWAFTTDNVEKTFEELKARGVRFEQEKPVVASFGTYATFADPDGNRHTIVQARAPA
jgi:catechol 2,3-dioxygenase-like lactoylglutathione lyase family enzyme